MASAKHAAAFQKIPAIAAELATATRNFANGNQDRYVGCIVNRCCKLESLLNPEMRPFGHVRRNDSFAQAGSLAAMAALEGIRDVADTLIVSFCLETLLPQTRVADGKRARVIDLDAVLKHVRKTRATRFKKAMSNAELEHFDRTAGLPRLAPTLADKLIAAAGQLETALGKSAKPAGNGSKRRRARSNTPDRPLTPKQAEAVHIVGECKGDIAEAARRLGKDRKTVKEHYDTAHAKMGTKAVQHGTTRLAENRRGQQDVAEGDDCRK